MSEKPTGTASAPEAGQRRRPTNGVAADQPANATIARAARPRAIERVRGTFDRLPADARRTAETQRALHSLVGHAGYAAIDTPVLEHTELFLRKSGGDRVAQLYAFTHHGRNVALRPEFTASVVRQFIEAWQGEPLPVRVAYTGPVFRYEKPQAGRARQFTEFGCELIGASGVAADVEVISLALDSLEQVGVEAPRLVLGHIGIVAGFLAGLHVDQRAQDWLTWSMERTRKRTSTQRDNPEMVGLESPPDLGTTEDDLPPYLRRLEASLDREHGDELSESADPDAVASILRQTGVAFQGGSRTPEEIVRGLFAKRDRRYDAQTLRDAAAFVARLTELAGPPDEVLGSIRDLVRSRALDESPIDAIEQTVDLLRATRDTPFDIHIDLGMGRGLHYYTGMLFEIYAGSGGLQLCGGGRYDDLASVLGARQPVAACGFSLGLERVLAAAPDTTTPVAPARVLVVQDGAQAADAVRLAAALRAAGWQAVLDLRRRNAGATRTTAARQGYGWIARGTPSAVQMLDLASGDERTFDLAPTPQDVMPHE